MNTAARIVYGRTGWTKRAELGGGHQQNRPTLHQLIVTESRAYPGVSIGHYNWSWLFTIKAVFHVVVQTNSISSRCDPDHLEKRSTWWLEARRSVWTSRLSVCSVLLKQPFHDQGFNLLCPGVTVKFVSVYGTLCNDRNHFYHYSRPSIRPMSCSDPLPTSYSYSCYSPTFRKDVLVPPRLEQMMIPRQLLCMLIRR